MKFDLYNFDLSKREDWKRGGDLSYFGDIRRRRRDRTIYRGNRYLRGPKEGSLVSTKEECGSRGGHQ